MIDVYVRISGEKGAGKTTIADQLTYFLIAKGYKVGNRVCDHNSTECFSISGTAIPIPPKTVAHTPDIGVMPTRINMTAIEEATSVIYGDREKTYGDPGKNLRIIAEYWTTHLKAKYHIKGPLTVDDVCVMMVLLKQARLVNSPKHRDSIVDSIGYMALADRVNVAEANEIKHTMPVSNISINT